MKRPLVRINIAFCAGIFIAAKFKINFPAAYFLSLLVLTAALLSVKKRQRFGILIFSFIFLLGMAHYAGAPKIKKNIYRKPGKEIAANMFILKAKTKIEAIISRYLSGVPASILEAMVLGEKERIPPLVNHRMIRSGTVHILVVSGFNVGLVAFIVVLFLKLMRLPRRLRILITIPLLVAYCLVTGASSPVVRATVMAAVFLAGYLLKREPDIYNSSAAAVLFILMLSPEKLFDLGFQLSFLSVLSIVWLYPKLKSCLRLDSLKIRPLKYLISGALVSFSAWLGTMFPIAYNFKIFSPVAVLANVLIVPLAGLITFCGFTLAAFHYICPGLNRLFAYTIELLVLILLQVNAFLISLPFASFYLP